MTAEQKHQLEECKRGIEWLKSWSGSSPIPPPMAMAETDRPTSPAIKVHRESVVKTKTMNKSHKLQAFENEVRQRLGLQIENPQTMDPEEEKKITVDVEDGPQTKKAKELRSVIDQIKSKSTRKEKINEFEKAVKSYLGLTK